MNQLEFRKIGVLSYKCFNPYRMAHGHVSGKRERVNKVLGEVPVTKLYLTSEPWVPVLCV